MRTILAAIAFAFAFAAPSGAVEPNEMLADPVLEARAQAISEELRCVVCQNESIDDSGAPLAHDMRLLVRERLTAGDNDAQVKAYLVARYGDFVLLKPPVQANTLVLWGAPFALLALGAAFGFFQLRKRAPAIAPLSEDEQRALTARLDAQKSGPV